MLTPLPPTEYMSSPFTILAQRTRHKGRFEFTYVSKSSVIVKELKTGKRIVLRSMYQHKIERINIYKDR